MRELVDRIIIETQPALAAAAAMAGRRVLATAPQAPGHPEELKGAASLSIQGVFRNELIKALSEEA